jgi:CBS domain-containing protein
MHRAAPLRPGQRLCEAATLMIEHQLPAVIVTNQANRFLGIVTENQLLSLMLRQLK